MTKVQKTSKKTNTNFHLTAIDMRTFKYIFTVECVGEGKADLARVEEMIDLNMQDLVMDDEFIAALDESEAVSIQVRPVADLPASE